MCGIAGILYDPAGQTTLDWKAFRAALETLRGQRIDPSHPQEFEPLFAGLEGFTPTLREYPVVRDLLGQAQLRTLMEECARSLEDWEVRTQTLVLAAEPTTEVVERWNALWVRCRDLAWTADRDVLGGLERLRRLLPAGLQHQEKAQFEAWKLAAVLENMNRLEVRGRDSLGLSLLVTFAHREAHNRFRDWLEQEECAGLFRRRTQVENFVDGAILEEAVGAQPTLVFTFKVAEEVGALGDNVAALVQTILEDRILWRALGDPNARTNVFSHTRWASNGIISEPNCHPVNDLTCPTANDRETPWEGTPRILVALNGDVDNYQELAARFARQTGRSIPAQVTTDTKIIPVLVGSFYRETRSLREAFCKAMQECEGSIAVVMHSSVEPDRIYLALRGSGQSMFVGLCAHGYTFASELYGVVEQTSKFVRMDGTGEREPGRPETAGQILVLDASRINGLQGLEAWSFDGARLELEPEDVKTAEITTRDINRGQFEHFLLKEISESPESVRKTLRGKFTLSRDGEPARVRMNLGEDVFPTALVDKLRQRTLRQVYLIGQGTAAVAGQAVASMMQGVLGSLVSVRAIKATELSGYSMLEDMSESLVIAISQSGTTTDTNRTVDLAKSRGAQVIAIVNRRNSDLVYKVDGVLYTSDGRDIEMSVASTKAFYSQVLAGYLLAYQMGLLMGTLSELEAHRELDVLQHLPDLMKQVLADHGVIRSLAETWAPTRRDWAVVGSGSTRAAADEIRIKLSELCYKSIATDYIEDKKHIDLSSEPLTLVCAAGLPLMALKDAVKEVAIFKSHKSIPIVVCSEGFQAFEPYAAGVIYVPKASENASVLLNTLVGHLWGYYCALAIDQGAVQLRPARAMAVKYLTATSSAPGLGILRQVLTTGKQFQENLARGRFNSSLSVDVGARLSLLFRYFTGAQPLRQFSQDFQASGTPESVAATLIANLTAAINELARPIDAIKHQAKTITVGISRLEEAVSGPLFEALAQLDISLEALPYRDLMLLRAITPAVRDVTGVTSYRVSGLGSLGEPGDATVLQVVAKLGASQNMRSRADRQYPLMGTKERVVRTRVGYVGRGGKDDAPIVILPVLPRGKVETLVLFHLAFEEQLPLTRKVMLLRDMQQRYDDLKSYITETDLEWSDGYLEELAAADLVTLPSEALNARVLEIARRMAVATA